MTHSIPSAQSTVKTGNLRNWFETLAHSHPLLLDFMTPKLSCKLTSSSHEHAILNSTISLALDNPKLLSQFYQINFTDMKTKFSKQDR